MVRRFAQTARLAGYASKAVNSAVSGLAYVGAKVAGGGEAAPACIWPGWSVLRSSELPLWRQRLAAQG